MASTPDAGNSPVHADTPVLLPCRKGIHFFLQKAFFEKESCTLLLKGFHFLTYRTAGEDKKRDI